MTVATDQFSDVATRAQEALTSAVRTWADTVQTVVGTAAVGRPALPDAHAAVDRYFDLAQQVLDNQRKFALAVLAFSAQAAETVTDQASKVTDTVTSRTVRAAENVGKAAESVGKATANAGKSGESAAEAAAAEAAAPKAAGGTVTSQNAKAGSKS
jgi:hypothetical protein